MIVFNFDVLARPHAILANRVPDPEGMRLWRDLHETHLGMLAIVKDEPEKVDLWEHWLLVNNIKASTYQLMETSDPQIKAEKVQYLMMSMGKGDWYIDTDPDTCAITMHMGIPTLLVANPYIVRPEWAGEKNAKPWDDIVAEVEGQVLMRNKRNWSEMQ